MVAVPDEERQRAAERPAVAKPGDHLDLVRFQALARAAAVALAPASQVAVDGDAVELKAGGKTAEDGNERRAVRLAGGHEGERH